ncbi:MAG: TonB-dependent receptor [Bacteroidota bacterium]
MKKTGYLILFFILLATVLYSQKGSLRGKVTDKGTGEELIGATILVKGTQTGTITDFDGNFSLDLAPGTYEIQCSYISYETIIISGVIIKKDNVAIQNVQLGEAVIGLKEVKVEARQARRTENALLTIQKKSASLINGISAQEISRLGDNDAAAALKRVTGVTVEGGKYVYIRGLSDRYSLTTLNGAEIPGLDPNKNTVQMDLFPTNIIENMVVHKTFTPELPASFTGGYVNIVTKDFPEKYTFQFSTSLGYNPQANLNKNFLTSEGGSLDWLGMDDGTRDWPIVSPKLIPHLYEDNDQLDQITQAFNTDMEPLRKVSFFNHSHSISVGNQVKVGEHKLGYVAALSYQRNYSYYDDGLTGRYELNGYGEDRLNTDRLLDIEKGTEEVLIGSMVNISYALSPNHKISLTGMRNQGGESSAKYADGIKPKDEIGMHLQSRELKYLERSITSGQLKGEHYFEKLNALKIDWLSSYTVSVQKQPDLRYFTNSYYVEDGDTSYRIEKSKYALPARYSRDMWESNFDNKMDFTLPFRYLGAKSKFRFGGAYVYKMRIFEESRIDIGCQNNSYTGDVQQYLSPSNTGQNAEGTYGIYLINATDKKNSYTGEQSVVAGYAMVDMPLSAKLRIVGGARLETTSVFVNSYDEKKPTGELDNTDILPALNLSYEVKKDMNIRAAYTRTLARPTFRELAPYASYDYETGETKIGNNELERTLIDNMDLRWEYFFSPGEIVSVSGFYKRFINPIEISFNPIAANPELTWENVEQANVYGFEAEFRKNLDFINPLRDFRAGVNFTWARSLVSIDSLELVAVRSTDPEYPDTRVMFGQSPYVVNAFLGYDNDSIGFSANLSYNVEGEKLAVVIVSGTPNIFEQPRHLLNFNISKKLGDRFTCKFSVNNILDAKNRFTYFYNDVEYTYESWSTGRTFSLGITYLVK